MQTHWKRTGRILTTQIRKGLITDDGYVIPYALEPPVMREQRVKALRIICDQLDVQAAFLVACIDQNIQLRNDVFGDRRVFVFPYTVTGPDSFFDIQFFHSPYNSLLVQLESVPLKFQ